MPHITQAYAGGDEAQRPGWWFAFDYDEKAIGQLKVSIPAEHRRWDADNKRWWVFKPYEKRLTRIFPNFAAFLNQPKLL